jgi:hypothetical protein
MGCATSQHKKVHQKWTTQKVAQKTKTIAARTLVSKKKSITVKAGALRPQGAATGPSRAVGHARAPNVGPTEHTRAQAQQGPRGGPRQAHGIRTQERLV